MKSIYVICGLTPVLENHVKRGDLYGKEGAFVCTYNLFLMQYRIGLRTLQGKDSFRILEKRRRQNSNGL